MRLMVAVEDHFVRDVRGNVHGSGPATLDYSFLQRYLEIFEEVVVLARVKLVPGKVAASRRADGPGVMFYDLPDYLGPWQYLRCLPALRRSVREAVESPDAFILRVPGAVTNSACRAIREKGLPFAAEVLADPWDLLSPGAVRTVLRPLIRRIWSRELRLICQEACAASYVTAQALQRRYPPSEGAYTTHYPSLDLPPEAFAAAPRVFTSSNGCRRLITVGTLTHMRKGPDVLIDALAICAGQGLDAKLTIVGDGKHRRELEAHVRNLGLEERVIFLGQVPSGEPVRRQIDDADVFVFPSRAEALGRALLEAMARGLPCVASQVGGIGELLPPEDLVPPGDADALARKIFEVLGDTDRMERMARRNWDAAKEYLPEVLTERRRAFYRRVREIAEESGSTRAGT